MMRRPIEPKEIGVEKLDHVGAHATFPKEADQPDRGHSGYRTSC